ncbi:glycoside hydrolase family 3 N-terminal domain-containing protein [Curtobacterium sp. VKM Ac-2887]|uniref:glycoside hydrolase family 3 N-terminal domain-containing protein n=1 Tax=Curtobacterium sp. VKM Ac-2887 TaxID=2783819 RepID=UPI00188CCC8D|nr:glycoside hydrolase family 3 N-terminal domain-containing protein [Curtobacterium sp. VKM Ac-2887]MBF4585690.1 glycoside hydrolase family 3 C-terminal domain-containing protein [Curtobacterium sp. VKM Ac-2887]
MSDTNSFRNASLPPGERAALLLAEMTIEEKAQQLTCIQPQSVLAVGALNPETAGGVLGNGIGQVAPLTSTGGTTPQQVANEINLIQRHLVENTRLGVPAVFHNEAIAGTQAPGHVVFPTESGVAATWSPELSHQMGDLVRTQMRRLGLRQALGPQFDVALEPRWGRVHETYGEDPYLASAFGTAYVSGLQTDDLANGVVATGKHFLGYGASEGGLNSSNVEAGSRRVRDVFARPFEAAIHVAGLRSVMNTYSEVDGVPAAISYELLTTLLRDTLEFQGYVSSDYISFQHVVQRAKAAVDAAEAGRLGIEAGLDLELPTPWSYGATLAEEVRAGRVDEAQVDVSVLRLLTTKFELGLFEQPYAQEHIDMDAVRTEGYDIANEMADRGVVLLQNDGILPLDLAKQPRVAVVGPHANAASLQYPAYTFPAAREVGLFMAAGGFNNMVGVEEHLPAADPSNKKPLEQEDWVRSEYGVRGLSEELAALGASVVAEPGTALLSELEDGAFERAVDAARDADVVVLAVGGGSKWFQGERTEGEASDSLSIELPEVQRRLIDAVAALGKPTVAVLVVGRPTLFPESLLQANAIVTASFNGVGGTRALARVVAGAVNPSGKLPFTIPRSQGQIPIFHHQRSASGYRSHTPFGNHYIDGPATPLFPFGHGLSYTSFEIADVAVTPDAITTDGEATISVSVRNSGDVAGAQVLQLYIRANTSGVTRPEQQLEGFARVALEPGEQQRVTFTLPAAQLGYTNARGGFSVDPGRVDVFVGGSSDDTAVTGSFVVEGASRPLKSSERSYFSTVRVDAGATSSH